MPARLVVHVPEQPIRTFELAAERARIVGRDASCDLVLDDPRVSRRHARLVPEDDRDEGWRLEDLKSKNGTFAAGVPAAGELLDDGVWVSFGGLLARFERVTEEMLRIEAERAASRWQTSMSLQASLDPAVGLDALLQQVLRSILEVSDAERGFVMLADAGGELEMAAAVGLNVEQLRSPAFAGSVGAIERALERAEPVTLSDARQDTILGGRPSIVSGGIRALVCLPLKVMERTIGVVYADSRETGHAFSSLDVEILSALASHAALAIAVARLHHEVTDIRAVMPPAAGDLTAVWDRTLPDYRPPAESVTADEKKSGDRTTWTRVLASHTRKATGARS